MNIAQIEKMWDAIDAYDGFAFKMSDMKRSPIMEGIKLVSISPLLSQLCKSGLIIQMRKTTDIRGRANMSNVYRVSDQYKGKKWSEVRHVYLKCMSSLRKPKKRTRTTVKYQPRQQPDPLVLNNYEKTLYIQLRDTVGNFTRTTTDSKIRKIFEKALESFN